MARWVFRHIVQTGGDGSRRKSFPSILINRTEPPQAHFARSSSSFAEPPKFAVDPDRLRSGDRMNIVARNALLRVVVSEQNPGSGTALNIPRVLCFIHDILMLRLLA